MYIIQAVAKTNIVGASFFKLLNWNHKKSSKVEIYQIFKWLWPYWHFVFFFSQTWTYFYFLCWHFIKYSIDFSLPTCFQRFSFYLIIFRTKTRILMNFPHSFLIWIFYITKRFAKIANKKLEPSLSKKEQKNPFSNKLKKKQ